MTLREEENELRTREPHFQFLPPRPSIALPGASAGCLKRAREECAPSSVFPYPHGEYGATPLFVCLSVWDKNTTAPSFEVAYSFTGNRKRAPRGRTRLRSGSDPTLGALRGLHAAQKPFWNAGEKCRKVTYFVTIHYIVELRHDQRTKAGH
jgi:hypothetical protein